MTWPGAIILNKSGGQLLAAYFMNRLIQKIFENRGYTQEFLREINNQDHQMLKDIDVMCVRLKQIHDAGGRLITYPDFDMDGIAAGTMGYAGLCELGFNAGLYVPDPSAGYGITQKSVADLLYRYPDTKAIITCDTGIGAMEAAAYCRTAGIEFLVTDHHRQDSVIPASVIVDPARQDECYPHPICGTFVFWQVLKRYAELYGTYMMQDQIARLKVFAGIGTISDGMPILYENRQVVRDAVMICRLIYGDGTTSSVGCIPGTDVYRLAFWGLYDFMKVCAENGVIRSSSDIDEDFFGWYLAPIFNSAKRMNGDMHKTFGIFFCGNVGTENPRRQYAQELYDLNNARKIMVAQKFKELMAADQPYAPYIYLTDAHAGICGLLATKLMKNTGLPSFVMTDHGANTQRKNRYSGSGRSPEWFPVISRLHGTDHLFIAGHEQAFGCGMDTEEHLQQFSDYLSRLIPEEMSKVEIMETKPDYVIDTDWSQGDIGIDLAVFDEYLDEIDNYRPFGKGFEEPMGYFRFRNQDVIQWRRIGKANEHLKISLPCGMDILCWNQGHLFDQQYSSSTHVVRGTLGRSEFRGNISIHFTGDFIEKCEIK